MSMIAATLLGVFQLLLLKCYKASDPSKINEVIISVKNSRFSGHTLEDYPKKEFKGYFVELDDPSGCNESLQIKDLQDGEANINDYVTYIDWYSTPEPNCDYNSVVSNLRSIGIFYFILVISPEPRSRRSQEIVNSVRVLEEVKFVILTNPDQDDNFDKFTTYVSRTGDLTYISVEVSDESEGSTSIPMSSMAILFVTVAFVTLMTVSIGWLVFYYAQRCRQRNMRERLQSRLCVAAKRAVGKLPTKTVPDHPKSSKRSKKTSPSIPDNDSTCSSCSSDEGEFCPVCLDLYKPREVIRILPCKHEFHKTCVDPWLFDHRTCPMCKLDILEHLGMPAGGDRLSTPVVPPPPDYSENQSTRVDQEVQTDFVNPSPIPHFTSVASETARSSRHLSDEIEPAPIPTQDV